MTAWTAWQAQPLRYLPLGAVFAMLCRRELQLSAGSRVLGWLYIQALVPGQCGSRGAIRCSARTCRLVASARGRVAGASGVWELPQQRNVHVVDTLQRELSQN
jgi:hypothetical protein